MCVHYQEKVTQGHGIFLDGHVIQQNWTVFFLTEIYTQLYKVTVLCNDNSSQEMAKWVLSLSSCPVKSER